MKKDISKEVAQNLYNSASTRVTAGANIKSAVVGNEQNNTNPQIDPRVVEAALKKVRA